jgi:hypothetical protein
MAVMALLLVGRDQAGLVGEHDCLGTVAQVEFHQNPPDVRFRRLFRDGQRLADLGVGHAASDQP